MDLVKRLKLSLVSLCPVFICLLFGGCENTERHSRSRDSAPALPPVALRGETHFFDGSVRAEVSVNRGRPSTHNEDASERASSRSGGGGRRGARSARGSGSGDMYGSSRSRDAGDDDAPAPRRPRPVAMAPLTLRLKLENKSAQPMDVMIHDFNSDLGNFAVRPEHLLLPAGETREVEPMVSQLASIADELPFTVVLRANGRTETQTIYVKLVPSSDGPAR